ncbi:ATP-dependent helicase [Candidatus Pacearchaeota archaeon]|nr:ATP-dependent helicase [Candidatus Pacearchaeota archaeon]
MTKVINIGKPDNKKEISKVLHPLIREWFFSKFKDFSMSQKYGVLSIQQKKNILISAPTGGGKTLTAFLSILNRLVTLAEKQELENKIYALYSSPLKALSNDIHKNLIEPLEEIQELAKEKNINLQKIRVGLRTGDTTTAERVKMAKTPPHILITTPESIAIILTTPKFVENLKQVKYIIIDEIHSLGNKRGVHLSLSLERINEMCLTSGLQLPTKIGLSATIEPIEEVAKYLVGIAKDSEREVYVARVPFNKKIDIQVLSPVKNLIEHPNPRQPMYQILNKLISQHKTTLIFTNTRAATERVVNYLKDRFPTDYTDSNIAAHHSSLSKDHRFKIEENLRNGELKVVVCSTSLELGIDIGFIDLVILLGSPKASSRAIQRIGRAGHKIHEIAKGRFIVLDRDDLIECSIIQKEILEGKIDKIHYPTNCLDVLSQQIFGMAINKIWQAEELLKTIRKSYCYSNLTKEDFYSVISYLSGEYGLEKNWVYAKIWYDPNSGEISKRGKLARVIYSTNIGTIPEESFVTVKLTGTGEKIGVLDEGFIGRMKKGDIFVLGGSTYQFAYTRGMNLYARPAPGKSPTIPSWFSETLPLSFDSAIEINKFRKNLRNEFEKNSDKKQILQFIKKQTSVTEEIAEQIYNYFEIQHKFSEIPHENLLTIEKYIDERDGKKYILFNSMYGRRVNDALSRAIAYLLGLKQKRDVEIGISDRGFYLACENIDIIEKTLEKLNSENIEEILKEAIEKTDILTRRFRHCATRALMILRSYKGRQKNVKKLQMKSHFLIAAVRKISSDFPILKEAKREILEDLMDIQNARKVLDWISQGKIKISTDYVRLPSPFAINLLLQGHMDLMRIEEKQDFLKRMHQVYQEEIAKKSKIDYGGDYSEWD